jgi:Ca2+/Na+ antiporter
VPTALLPVVLAGLLLAILVEENVRTLKLRDPLTLGGAAAVAALVSVTGALRGEVDVAVGALVGGALTSALLLLAFVVVPGFGFGTVKAGLLVGLAAGALGADALMVSIVALAVALALTGLVAWRREVPTGPALGVAYVAACLNALL